MHNCEFCRTSLPIGVGTTHAGQVFCGSDCVEAQILKRIEERHKAWKRAYDERKPTEVPHYYPT